MVYKHLDHLKGRKNTTDDKEHGMHTTRQLNKNKIENIITRSSNKGYKKNRKNRMENGSINKE